MARVCLIVNWNFSRFNRTWTQALRNLGIEYAVCVATSGGTNAVIQTPQGEFAPASSDLRNYFRQFDAVTCLDNVTSLSMSSFINYSVFWLSWNDADDPAFLFFNPYFSTAITEHAYNANFPNDFPIIRPNPTNIAGTLYAADGGTPSPQNPPTNLVRTGARGACILFLAENIRAHVITICNTHTDHIPYFWKLDTNKHSRLAETRYTHRVSRNGRAGEILAVPASPISSEDTESYPPDCIVAYRYKNIFWLPHTAPRSQHMVNIWSTAINPYLFWLLYGLQLAGVQPRYRIPIQMETDHALEARAIGRPFYYTIETQLRILEASWAWMRDFARTHNTAIIAGIQVGGRDRQSYINRHWFLLYGSSLTEGERAAARRVHEILVAGHREGSIPCGPHDHTVGSGSGYWGAAISSGFRRHAGGRYGAPNDVPIARGRFCIAPHILPEGARGADAIHVNVGHEELIEWGFDERRTRTSTTFDLPMDNLHAALIIIESEIDEMLALGFPDGHCGEHRYTNTAANKSGGECYWQALRKFGFRGVRSSQSCTGIDIKVVSPNWIWNGFHLIGGQLSAIDVNSSSAFYLYGLYHPDAPPDGDAVRFLQLDYERDISSDYMENPSKAWRAYRRVQCQIAGIWLHKAAVELSTVYLHPLTTLTPVSLSDPVEPFRGWVLRNVANHPHYNHIVEVLLNMDAIVRLLPKYLYWGTITDVMDHRERIMNE